MFISNCKVFFDGDHYTAVVPTKRPRNRREKKEDTSYLIESVDATMGTSFVPETRVVTRREAFEELYEGLLDKRYYEQVATISREMLPFFDDAEATVEFVKAQRRRVKRNLWARKIRLFRKLSMQDFNFFCTFTYSDSLHTETSFKSKLKGTLKNLCYRRGWRYIGAWERGADTQRLHFHAIMDIPEGEMVGRLVEVEDYDTRSHRRQKTVQNTFFNKRYGRSDFSAILSSSEKEKSVLYLVKYIEKTGGRVVYSRGLPEFFVSDINTDDVFMPLEDSGNTRLLLYDDFTCWNEGCCIGQVNKATISVMPKGH